MHDEYEFVGEFTTKDLGMIDNDNSDNPWMTEISVEVVPMKFKLDCRSRYVSVISEKDFLKIRNYLLKEPDRNLYKRGKKQIEP